MKQCNRLKGILLAVCLFVCGLSVLFAVRNFTEVSADTARSTDDMPDEFIYSDAATMGNENAVIVWSNTASGSVTAEAQFTPTEDYTLKDVKYLAIKLINSRRASTRTNGTAVKTTDNGLTALNIKLSGNDTVTWNLHQTAQSDPYLTVKLDNNTVSTIGTANKAVADKGGLIGIGADEKLSKTVYIPLSKLYADAATTDDQILTAQTGYENWTLEYIQFSINTWRWDLAIGDIGFIKYNETDGWSAQKLSLTSKALVSSTGTNNCTIVPYALTDGSGGQTDAAGIAALGASIRYNAGDKADDGGIRFGFEMKDGLLNTLQSGSNITFGMLILPDDLKGDALTVSSDKAANVTKDQLTWVTGSAEGVKRAMAYLRKIPSESYSRAICARFYVTVTESNGDTETFYSEEVVRSVAEVAQAAYAKTGNEALKVYFPVVTLQAGEGTGEAQTYTLKSGLTYVLPECPFTAPEGKQFSGWKIGETVYQPGAPVTVSGAVTVTAQYTDTATAE